MHKYQPSLAYLFTLSSKQLFCLYSINTIIFWNISTTISSPSFFYLLWILTSCLLLEKILVFKQIHSIKMNFYSFQEMSITSVQFVIAARKIVQSIAIYVENAWENLIITVLGLVVALDRIITSNFGYFCLHIPFKPL